MAYRFLENKQRHGVPILERSLRKLRAAFHIGLGGPPCRDNPSQIHVELSRRRVAICG